MKPLSLEERSSLHEHHYREIRMKDHSRFLPRPAGVAKGLLDPDDALVCLLDHQSGLFQTVKDISVAELPANTTMLAKLASLLDIPVITSASVPQGPNGPLMPEIHQAAPHAVFVPRKGEDQCLGQRPFPEDRSRDRQKDADHRRRVDERMRRVPGTGREGAGVQCIHRA
jgi:hypothetical protein